MDGAAVENDRDGGEAKARGTVVVGERPTVDEVAVEAS
jgi:hypothetical protein